MKKKSKEDKSILSARKQAEKLGDFLFETETWVSTLDLMYLSVLIGTKACKLDNSESSEMEIAEVLKERLTKVIKHIFEVRRKDKVKRGKFY